MTWVPDVENQDRDALGVRHLRLAGEDCFELEKPVGGIDIMGLEVRDTCCE
jgi:hypothetical protein